MAHESMLFAEQKVKQKPCLEENHKAINRLWRRFNKLASSVVM